MSENESISRPAQDLPAGGNLVEPPLVASIEGHRLERCAVQLGTLAGKSMALFRRVQRRVLELDDERWPSSAKIRQISASLSREASEQAGRLRCTAKERTVALARQAKTGYTEARECVQHAAHERPLHFVLAAGAVGLGLGAGLRVWRSGRG